MKTRTKNTVTASKYLPHINPIVAAHNGNGKSHSLKSPTVVAPTPPGKAGLLAWLTAAAESLADAGPDAAARIEEMTERLYDQLHGALHEKFARMRPALELKAGRLQEEYQRLREEARKTSILPEEAGPVDKRVSDHVWLTWVTLAMAAFSLLVDWANAARWVLGECQDVVKSFLYTIPVPLTPIGLKVLVDMTSGAVRSRILRVLTCIGVASGLCYFITLAVNYGGGGLAADNLGTLLAGQDLRLQLVSQLLLGVVLSTGLFLWWQHLTGGISEGNAAHPRYEALTIMMEQKEAAICEVQEEIADVVRQETVYLSDRKVFRMRIEPLLRQASRQDAMLKELENAVSQQCTTAID